MPAFPFPNGCFLSFLQARDSPSYAESNGVIRPPCVGYGNGKAGGAEKLAAILFKQELPLGKNRLPVPAYETPLMQGIEQNGHTADIVYSYMEVGLTAEQRSHIIGGNLLLAEQTEPVGAGGNSLQLDFRKIAAKRKGGVRLVYAVEEGMSGAGQSTVSYNRFSSANASNVNDEASKNDFTRAGQSFNRPLTMWMFISWQFLHVVRSHPIYR